MIRRLFGIGRKKQNKTQNSASMDAPMLLHEIPKPTEPSFHFNTSESVVPLRSSELTIKKKKDTAEIFNEAVNKLVEKLEGINENLENHITQNAQLVERMDALPKAVEQQRQAFSDVAQQLRLKLENDEKVARELVGIHEKVAASNEIDQQMARNFTHFSQVLGKLDTDTVSQTEWIQQMSKTFSASERYIKYTLAKQQARFYWIFGISMGICLVAIICLVLGIVLLAK